MMAYAGVFGFGKALKENRESEMPATKEKVYDETTAAGKLTKVVLKRNLMTMAFTTDITMVLVFEAMDDDWPSGLAHKVIAEIK
jgi:hypothetical protein